MSTIPTKKFSIAIIGGGFSGTMLAVHLMNQNKIPLHIIMINSGYPLSKGVAYSSYSHKHLLNVAAKNMSAFPDNPQHFMQWIKKHENYGVLDAVTLPDMYLPRNVYGYYLKDIFDSTIRKKPESVEISFVHDEAVDAEMTNGKATVYFSFSPPVTVDKVVIASGNETPDRPNIENMAFYQSKNYFGNPWQHESVNHLPPEDDVLIIGNGLTMVDVVIGLREKKHKGKIYSLSPNGFKILPHRPVVPYRDLMDELQPPYDLLKLVKLFRKHVKILRSQNLSAETLVDSMRPLTQTIWQSWTFREKKRFMYHMRHLWGVARHRLPMPIHQQIQQYILDHSLEIVAGRILNITEDENGIDVLFRRKNTRKPDGFTVKRVINCTGPKSDISKVDKPLFRNLISRNIICPDEMKLGINALPDGTIINADGRQSTGFYSIGSLLKGILWESTAVPELRVQAKQLSEKLISVFAGKLDEPMEV